MGPARATVPGLRRYGGGRGGGFFSGLFGGLGGALAGNWLYDQFSGRHGGRATRTPPPIRAGESRPYARAATSSSAATMTAAGEPPGATPAGAGGDWGGGEAAATGAAVVATGRRRLGRRLVMAASLADVRVCSDGRDGGRTGEVLGRLVPRPRRLESQRP